MAVDPDSLIPPNSGCWRTIEVKAPKGSVVNAEFPAPVVYANHEISHRVADMVMGALAGFWPTHVMACSQGTSAILTLGGVDPRSGRRYVSYETIKGGFGARPTKDGINVIASGISNTMNTPVEVLEMAFPVRIERYEINPDSGGAGRYRGGCGARRVWRLLEGADATGALCMERMTSPPFGLLGGKAGARRRRHADDAGRRHPPSAEQGRLPCAGRLGRRHDRAGLGRLRAGRASAIRPPSAATCSTATSPRRPRNTTTASPTRRRSAPSRRGEDQA